MSFTRHTLSASKKSVFSAREKPSCQCINSGEVVGMQEHLAIQKNLDQALASKRALKAQIMMTLGLIESESQFVSISDEELVSTMRMASGATI